MRKIIVIALVLIASMARAQTFPSRDSLIRFIDKNIRTSIVESYKNMRMNTALHGILNEIDSATVGASGFDSTYIYQYVDDQDALNVKYTDTALMLLAYRNALLARMLYADSSAMLAAYQTALNARIKWTDTSALFSDYRTALNARILWTDTSLLFADYRTALNNRSLVGHTHDDRYYTETETDALLGAKQPLDGDLTTIAGLTATTDNFIVSVASAWASRTPSQVKTTLALNNVDNTSDLSKPISTAVQAALDGKSSTSHTHAFPDITGSVADGQLSSNVALKNINNNFSTAQTFTSIGIGAANAGAALLEFPNSTVASGGIKMGDITIYRKGAQQIQTNAELFSQFSVYTPAIYNYTSTNRAGMQLADNGAIITRNIADVNPALIINQVNALSTGKILDLQFGGVTKASVDKDGNLVSVGVRASALITNGYLKTTSSDGTFSVSTNVPFSDVSGITGTPNGTKFLRDDGSWQTVSSSSSGYTIVSVTSTTYNATQTSGDIIILVDAATAGGNVTVNLPTAVSNTAKFTIKKIDSGSNTVTIDGSGAETIDGQTTQEILFQNTSTTIVNNNTNWFKI